MILLWIIVISHGIVTHGKYFLIETGHNMTSKDYLEAGSGCIPGTMREEIKCAGGWSNCYPTEVVADTALECRAKVKEQSVGTSPGPLDSFTLMASQFWI